MLRRTLQRMLVIACLASNASMHDAAQVASPIYADRTHLLLDPLDFELGSAGCQLRGCYLLVGSSAYLYFLRTIDTIDTGYDPGDFPDVFPDLTGRTGYACVLPDQTLLSAEETANEIAAALLTIPGVSSATVAGSDETDGRRRIDIVATGAVAASTLRSHGDRGAAGLWGGHLYRMSRAGESFAATSLDLTAPGASAVDTWPADAIVWAVGVMLGSTVSTSDTARPRLSMRLDATVDATPVGAPLLMDFGQIRSSQIVAGSVGYVFLTPAQCLEAWTARQTVGSGRVWLSAHASGGCHIATTGLTGTGTWTDPGDELAAGVNLRLHGSAVAGNAAPPTTWTEGGNAPAYLHVRLAYEQSPATDGSRIWTALGCAVASALAPTNLGPLANVVALQTGEGDTRLHGARIYGVRYRIGTGPIRPFVAEGGSGTKDAPNAVGADVILDLGQSSGTGEVLVSAPTGASAVYFGTSLSGHRWMGAHVSGASYFGQFAQPATILGPPHRPSSSVRRFTSPGNLTMQGDVANGNPATPPTDPVAGTYSAQTGMPWQRVECVRLGFAA